MGAQGHLGDRHFLQTGETSLANGEADQGRSVKDMVLQLIPKDGQNMQGKGEDSMLEDWLSMESTAGNN